MTNRFSEREWQNDRFLEFDRQIIVDNDFILVYIVRYRVSLLSSIAISRFMGNRSLYGELCLHSALGSV